MFLFFSACQETLVESEVKSKSKNNLEKETEDKSPDTYVHGYVTKDNKPAKYASVKLLDSSGNQLTSTSADGSGYYIMEVCPYGFGFRTVEATYLGETGSNHFTYVFGT